MQWHHFLFRPCLRKFACPLRWRCGCTKASEKRRRFGAEECFFYGARGGSARRRPEVRLGTKTCRSEAEGVKKTCAEWKNRPKSGRKYKKAGLSRLFCGHLAVFCCVLVVWRGAWSGFRLAFGTIRPQGGVGAAARALDDQEVNVALGKFFAAMLAAQLGEGVGGGYAHGWPSRGRPARSASQRELISKYSGESSTPV